MAKSDLSKYPNVVVMDFKTVTISDFYCIHFSGNHLDEGHLLKIEGGGYMCGICGYVGKHSQHVKRHLDRKHDMGHYPCPFCGKIFKEEDNRYKHAQKVHRQAVSYKQLRDMPPQM